MRKITNHNYSDFFKDQKGQAMVARVGHINKLIEDTVQKPADPVVGSTLVWNGSEYISQTIIGGGIGGTQYIFVKANGTDTENATELQAAYDTAKTMSPSADNRITVVAAPGTYKFTNTFVMDTEFIDLVSLTGNRDVVFDLDGIIDPFQYDTDTFDVISIGECLLIDTDNVFVKGIKGKFYLSPNFDDWYGIGQDYTLPIQVSDNLPNIVIENCEGGAWSFGGDFTFSESKNISGTFRDCRGYVESFGGVGGTASGVFKNCIGSFISFGETASGMFSECVGGFESFGGYNSGTASGTFINCISGDVSFGGNGTLSGKLFYCRLTSGTFETVSGGGRTYYCVDGNGDPNNQ